MKKIIEKLLPREHMVKDHNRLFGIGLAVLAFLYIGHQVPRRLLFTMTPSVDHRLFYYQRKVNPQSLKKGDYVVFAIRSKLIHDCNPCTLIKKIGCTQGEMLRSTTAGAYYCGGKFLGLAKAYSLKGEPMDRFVFNGLIPKDRFFLVGNHRDSYDSRYFGFIARVRIEGRAIPFTI